MDIASQVQTLDETVYISHSSNTLEEDMNPVNFPPTMSKSEFFNLGMATSLGEG